MSANKTSDVASAAANAALQNLRAASAANNAAAAGKPVPNFSISLDKELMREHAHASRGWLKSLPIWIIIACWVFTICLIVTGSIAVNEHNRCHTWSSTEDRDAASTANLFFAFMIGAGALFFVTMVVIGIMRFTN